MIALIKGLQLLLSLSILVVLHELGHYLAARYFKTRVEKFYLFMNPGFSIFKKQIGETEWGIGWLPLGGYVKISGMIDESMDTEQMANPPQPWEFRSKPAWQRLIIMLGGIIMNLLVGYLIYCMILFCWGEDKILNDFSVNVDPRMEEFGFQNGDQILKYNGQEVEYYGELSGRLFSEKVTEVTVLRDGVEAIISLEKELGQILIDSGIRPLYTPLLPTFVELVNPGSKAEKAGLAHGDVITAIDGKVVGSSYEATQQIQSIKSSPLLLTVNRSGEELILPAMTDSLGKLGFAFQGASQVHIDYTFGESIAGGYHKAYNTLHEYVVSLRFLASPAGASQVGSLITFGSIFSPNWDWHRFWKNTALLSLILAFMNLLPIPALDGGHVMFLLYEMVVGKPAPDKILEYAQIIGIICLLGLMVFALGNDFFRLFTGGFS
ncbi:MAG: RIP metalloprotease RseP [Crocinitomicaceae bacterium]|nr:RIP metalloprotease RseP [Crocinitomicaceae bacterium]